MKEIIFKIFLAGFETFLFIFFLDSLLTKINELKKERYFAFLLYFIFQITTYFIDFAFFSTSYYYIFFTVFISLLFYYNELRIKLISSSMFVTLNYASKLLSVVIFTSFNRITLTTNPIHYVLNNQMQMIANLIMLLSIITIIEMRKLSNKISKVIVNILIFILPLLILYMSMHLLNDLTPVNFYFNITMMLFCYTFLLFFITDQIAYSNINAYQSQLMNERLQMQTIYYQDIEEYNQKMSHYKHDMMGHLSNIYGMLEQNNIQEAKDYLTSINHQMQKVEAVISTGNSIIDIILNAKVKIAKENNIAFYHDIVVPPRIDMNNVDLSVILSNILDNAIEASLKIEKDRIIEISIHIYKDSLFINVKNRFDGELISSESNYLSTKKNNHEHGIGLKNVKYVVNQYHGTQKLEHDNQTFTVSIMIPNMNHFNP